MRKESATLCVTGGKIVRHSYGLGSYCDTRTRRLAHSGFVGFRVEISPLHAH